MFPYSLVLAYLALAYEDGLDIFIMGHPWPQFYFFGWLFQINNTILHEINARNVHLVYLDAGIWTHNLLKTIRLIVLVQICFNQNSLINEGSDFLKFGLLPIEEPRRVGHVEEVDPQEGLDRGVQPCRRHLSASLKRKFLEKCLEMWLGLMVRSHRAYYAA